MYNNNKLKICYTRKTNSSSLSPIVKQDENYNRKNNQKKRHFGNWMEIKNLAYLRKENFSPKSIIIMKSTLFWC